MTAHDPSSPGTASLRQQLADQVGYYFAAQISGNNQPHMSGDPRARLHGERRRRFDETCLEVVDTISAALRSPDVAATPTPPSFKDVERLIVEYFNAAGANVEFEDAEWHAQFDDPISLTSLAIEVAKVTGDPAQASGVREALELAEDVLSRAPFSTGIWPNGVHPNTGIKKIRDAISSLSSPHAQLGVQCGDEASQIEFLARVMAFARIGDPNARDIKNEPRWKWFVEDAKRYLQIHPNLFAAKAKPEEVGELVKFFRGEGYDRFGRNGDYREWSPEHTAIEAMRELAALSLPVTAKGRETEHEPGCQSGDFGPCDCALSSAEGK